MATDPTRLWPEIAADALDECNELRELLREALPELRGELWQESLICGVCYQYDGHRAGCLVTRIEEALK